MTYLDNLEMALGMAFERDPYAFSRNSTYDRGDVTTRTVFATIAGVGADEIGDADVAWARTLVQSRRHSILELIQRSAPPDDLADTSPTPAPTGLLIDVIDPSRFPFVDVLEDVTTSATTRFQVIGQSQDGSRVFGLNGATLIDAPASQFPERPVQGARFTYEREHGIRAAETEIALEL